MCTFFLRRVTATARLSFSRGFLCVCDEAECAWGLSRGVTLGRSAARSFTSCVWLCICAIPPSPSPSLGFWFWSPPAPRPQMNPEGPDGDLYKGTGGLSLWPPSPSLAPSFTPHRLEGETGPFTVASGELEVPQTGCILGADWL